MMYLICTRFKLEIIKYNDMFDSSMIRVINHFNKQLDKHHLSLNNSGVLTEHVLVNQYWNDNLLKITKPIKFLIIGEAPINAKNYFYNPNSTQTSFLTPSHFGCNRVNSKDKMQLIEYLNENGILVFDLYPLPLSTFIYDNVNLNCVDIDYERAMVDYYSKLLTIINEKTIIVLRYSKLVERCEIKLFLEVLNRKMDDLKFISSTNIYADKNKINEIFCR